MIIAFGYEKQVGKDTACKYLTQKGFVHLKFATLLKEIAGKICNIWPMFYELERVKSSELPPEFQKGNRKTHRHFLEDLGEHLRTFDPDIFVNSVVNQINDNNCCISDLRHVNEFHAIKDLGGITVRIIRNTGIPKSHITDFALDNIKFDYEIENNGTIEELQEKVQSIVSNNVLYH